MGGNASKVSTHVFYVNENGTSCCIVAKDIALDSPAFNAHVEAFQGCLRTTWKRICELEHMSNWEHLYYLNLPQLQPYDEHVRLLKNTGDCACPSCPASFKTFQQVCQHFTTTHLHACPFGCECEDVLEHLKTQADFEYNDPNTRLHGSGWEHVSHMIAAGLCGVEQHVDMAGRLVRFIERAKKKPIAWTRE